ncbi:nuclear transport factor 2 family protein [Micrococcaceae bacterium Sec5.7]
MTLTDDINAGPLSAINRLLTATNKHDLPALVDCFAPGYVNETPAHPLRGFTGREQVRSNWEQLFAGVPDLSIKMLSHSVSGHRVWIEASMDGTRRDGTSHSMAGVLIFEVDGGVIASARFYLEPVERQSGDINDSIDRVTHRVTHGRAAP